MYILFLPYLMNKYNNMLSHCCYNNGNNSNYWHCTHWNPSHFLSLPVCCRMTNSCFLTNCSSFHSFPMPMSYYILSIHLRKMPYLSLSVYLCTGIQSGSLPYKNYLVLWLTSCSTLLSQQHSCWQRSVFRLKIYPRSQYQRLLPHPHTG